MPCYEMFYIMRKSEKQIAQYVWKYIVMIQARFLKDFRSCNVNGLHLFTHESSSRIDDNLCELRGEQMLAYFYLYSFSYKDWENIQSCVVIFSFIFIRRQLLRLYFSQLKAFCILPGALGYPPYATGNEQCRYKKERTKEQRNSKYHIRRLRSNQIYPHPIQS